MSSFTSPVREGGVWAPQRRWLTIGLVATITLFASEALAIATIMPKVAEELGRSGYGAAFSAFFLGSVVSALVGGEAADRFGPAPVLLSAGVLFAAGLLLGGLAPAMWLLVAARALQGLGAGTSTPVVYAVVGRAYPQAAQIRMFALISTAWVAPAVVGPGLAGVVAEWVGWRWVFFGILPLVIVALGITTPPLRRVAAEKPARCPQSTSLAATAGAAIALAGGVGLVLAGLESSSLLRAAVLLAAGGLFAFVLGEGLVPSGVLRMRRGLPATLALRGLLTAAFAGSDAFLPLAVTGIRGRSVLVASLVVSSVTITWTAGSWVADRFLSTWGVTRLVTAGFVILAVGIGWETALLTPSIPLGVAMIGTGFAGLGIGLAFSPLSTAALGAATAGGEGRASGALALIENLGFALGPGITGALVGLSERGHLSLAGALGWGWGIAALVGVLAAVLAHRMITSPA